MEKPVNALSLTGTIAHMPEFSHDVFGEPFYQLTLAVPRLSGVHDMLPVTASQRLLDMVSPAQDMPLHLEGQVRSYNKMIDGVGRLLITAFAQRLAPPEGNENPNTVLLCGALCKPPALPDHALRPGNCGPDAGGEPRLREKRLYPLHRLGAKRALRRPG